MNTKKRKSETSHYPHDKSKEIARVAVSEVVSSKKIIIKRSHAQGRNPI
jgi:hypothetical protein